MGQRTNLLFLLVISSLIIRTFSAVILKFEDENEIEFIRSDLKEQSVHRGVLLSYSEEEKNQLCKDYFHAQLYEAANDISMAENYSHEDVKVTDEPTNKGKPQHTVEVTECTNGEKPESVKLDIFFKCSILHVMWRKPVENVYLVSSAFQPNWFCLSTFDQHEKFAKLDHYMGKSPELVKLDQDALEKQYVTMWQTIAALQAESPEYVELIEKKDGLSALTRYQRQLLCASILSSPVYQEERLEVTKQFIENIEDVDFDDVKKLVSFNNRDVNIPVESNCIPCYGFEDSADIFDTWNDLCVTKSYDDLFSAYVLKEDYLYVPSRWFLSKYFKNVPVLMNAHEPITEGKIFDNY